MANPLAEISIILIGDKLTQEIERSLEGLEIMLYDRKAELERKHPGLKVLIESQ